MTDDIVARLRSSLSQRKWWPRDRLEAADEIERLRAALLDVVEAGSSPVAYMIARTALEGEKDND
jgi:hypothetical protein